MSISDSDSVLSEETVQKILSGMLHIQSLLTLSMFSCKHSLVATFFISISGFYMYMQEVK